MRWMFCLLMILGAAPPALTAAHRYNRLILLTFFQAFVGALASALAGRPGNAESALMRLIGVLGLVGILASPPSPQIMTFRFCAAAKLSQ